MSSFFQDRRTVPEYLASKLVEQGEIPRHVAVILDGNRRFARSRNFPVIEGHKSGGAVFRKFCNWMKELGVKEVTGYLFAIENFNRSEHEVAGIMEEVKRYFEDLLPFVETLKQTGLVQIVGDPNYVPNEIKPYIARLVNLTKDVKLPDFKLNFAFCYSAQHELARRTERLQTGVKSGELLEEDVTFGLIKQLPHIRDSYPVDLLVRTSGETRLSNFLLLEASSALVEFVPETWPELGFWRMASILLKYQHFRTNVPRKEEPLMNSRQVRFLERLRKEAVEELEALDTLEKNHREEAVQVEKGLLYKLKFWFSDQPVY